ncbi:CbtB domain-containing protein [Arenibaculum pallidiluteum]|uniref:CbtB domain-containing protein n=1 Tax=Arenibaculum pallidiluteum TaxID=2812559 RepID=UPI002E28CE06|nr:CbtB-domain containing protein [Arenibaculum pallidiluteum]
MTTLPASSLSATGRAGARAETVLSAAVAFAMGAFLLFGAGFAGSDLLHAAAHDARHAFSFPCH